MKLSASLVALASTLSLAAVARAQATPPDLDYHPQLPPKELDYEEGKPIPLGYHIESHPRKGVLITGLGTFGGFWVVSVIASFVPAVLDGLLGAVDTRDLKACIPIAGPFTMLGGNTTHGNNPVFWASMGVGQSLGAVITLIGIMPRERFVRDDDSKPKIHVAPMITGSAQGIGLMGTF